MGTLNARRVLVTGASGYVGAAVVSEALARGHEVVALSRRDPSRGLRAHPRLRTVAADLAGSDLVPALRGVDVVIHTAATLAGSEAEMRRDTLRATERLVRAMAEAGSGRLVLVGSMAVYGFAELEPGSSVSEDTPLEKRFGERDAYCRAKLAQEEIAARECVESGIELWILRAGAVWGPSRLHNAHLGLRVGPCFVAMGEGGELPLVHRDHCAEALVLAAETAVAPGGVEIVNVLDDDRPSRARYLRAWGGAGRVIAAPWRALDALTRVRIPRAPGLLRRPVVRARLMPLTYSNRRLHERLGWSPRYGFEAAMEAAKAEERTS